MADLSAEERDAMIRENPLYAKIICRCESISEGEIIDCIHRNCGARSVKGVKKESDLVWEDVKVGSVNLEL